MPHFMLPGSHERPDGPQCSCGASWDYFADKCSTQRTITEPASQESVTLSRPWKPGDDDALAAILTRPYVEPDEARMLRELGQRVRGGEDVKLFANGEPVGTITNVTEDAGTVEITAVIDPNASQPLLFGRGPSVVSFGEQAPHDDGDPRVDQADGDSPERGA